MVLIFYVKCRTAFVFLFPDEFGTQKNKKKINSIKRTTGALSSKIPYLKLKIPSKVDKSTYRFTLVINHTCLNHENNHNGHLGCRAPLMISSMSRKPPLRVEHRWKRWKSREREPGDRAKFTLLFTHCIDFSPSTWWNESVKNCLTAAADCRGSHCYLKVHKCHIWNVFAPSSQFSISDEPRERAL